MVVVINLVADRNVNLEESDGEEEGCAMVDEGEDDPEARPDVGLEEMLDDITIASGAPDDDGGCPLFFLLDHFSCNLSTSESGP